MLTDITVTFVSDFYGIRLDVHTKEGRQVIKKIRGIEMGSVYIRPHELDNYMRVAPITFDTTNI